MQKPPRDDSRYTWTNHVWGKMRQYGISESRIKRIVRFPDRIEEGIAPETVAVMQPTNPVTLNGKRSWRQEIWVMYKLTKTNNQQPTTNNKSKKSPFSVFKSQPKIKVITAWRYPGVSPARDPVPSEIIQEVQRLL